MERRHLGRRPPSAGRCGSPARPASGRSPRRRWSSAPAASPSRSCPRSTGIETFQGDALPLGALGPRRRPGRQAGRRGRHRRLGDPDRARAAAGAPAHLDVYQRTAPWVIPRNDRTTADSSGPRCAGCRPWAGSTGPASTGPTRATCRRSRSQPKLAAPARKAARAEHRQGHQGPDAARQGHAELRDRLQADPAVEHVLPRARRRQHRGGHRPDREGHRQRDRHRRRRRAPGRRDRRGHRLPHDRAADHRAHHRDGRPHPRRRVAQERDGGLQGHDRARASPTCS